MVLLTNVQTLSRLIPAIDHQSSLLADKKQEENNEKTIPGGAPRNTPIEHLLTMPKSVDEAFSLILSFRNDSKATFVQIGANDGQMFDPLYPHLKDVESKRKWIGLLVEPQGELFRQLTVLHADAPDWSFYNGVLSDEKSCQNGVIYFCETKTPGTGNYLTQGQLNGVRTNSSDCDAATMHEVARPCVDSWKKLFLRHGGPALLEHIYDGTRLFVDFVQIDTEGKDGDLIFLMDFDKIMKPTCIRYEHKVMLGPQQVEVVEHLQANGYTIVREFEDTLACLV